MCLYLFVFVPQIVLHSCPKKLRQLLKKEELPPADRCPTLILQFPQRSTVCSNCIV